MLADLKRLSEEELGPIEPLIAAARNELAKTTTPAGRQALNRAEGHQKEVEETLRSLLERLEPWSGAGEMRGEARSILSELRRQIELLQQMQAAQKPGVVGEKRNDLTPEIRNELDRAAVRPERLAERVRQLLEKIDRLVEDKQKVLKDKLEHLQEQERRRQDQIGRSGQAAQGFEGRTRSAQAERKPARRRGRYARGNCNPRGGTGGADGGSQSERSAIDAPASAADTPASS